MTNTDDNTHNNTHENTHENTHDNTGAGANEDFEVGTDTDGIPVVEGGVSRELGRSEQAEPSANAPDRERTPDDVQYDLIAALKTVYDPEIPVDIYELGLIYAADVNEAGEVSIVMTLTSPMCPVAETLPPEVEAKAREVEGVTNVSLELVWEPPWDMEMMSPAARLELNM
jgi:FeS assembly SUF system protein